MKILLTGGAGFIGSNLTASVLNNPQVSQLTVLDNLATGFERNIEEFKSNGKFKFVIGDIRDSSLCENLTCQILALASHALQVAFSTPCVRLVSSANLHAMPRAQC